MSNSDTGHSADTKTHHIGSSSSNTKSLYDIIITPSQHDD